jgi:hypothetical protein
LESDKATSKCRSKNHVDLRINGKRSVILHCVKTHSEQQPDEQTAGGYQKSDRSRMNVG